MSASVSYRMNQKAEVGLEGVPYNLEIIKSAEFRKEYEAAPIDQKTAYD